MESNKHGSRWCLRTRPRNLVNFPIELQRRIWSMAARFEEPTTWVFVTFFFSLPIAANSSSIDYPADTSRPFPTVLHICRQSREEELKVYTPLRTLRRLHVHTFINTLYDMFYIGANKWDNFKILIDLIIKRNTTRQLVPGVKKDVEALRNIRFLIVDFNIFGDAPAQIWAEFPRLEKLTVAFYPFEEIRTVDFPTNQAGLLPSNLEFVKPQRGTRHGKRAGWVLSLVKSSLEAAKTDDLADWKIPLVEVVVRMTGESCDGDVHEEYTDRETTDGNDYDEEEQQEKDEIESNWRNQAVARMRHTVQPEQLRRWKRKYLPSKKVYRIDAMMQRRTTGKYHTDSETEQGNFSDPLDSYDW